MVFYIGAQDGLKTLAKWPKDPGIFSIYRSIDRGYLHCGDTGLGDSAGTAAYLEGTGLVTLALLSALGSEGSSRPLRMLIWRWSMALTQFKYRPTAGGRWI